MTGWWVVAAGYTAAALCWALLVMWVRHDGSRRP